MKNFLIAGALGIGLLFSAQSAHAQFGLAGPGCTTRGYAPNYGPSYLNAYHGYGYSHRSAYAGLDHAYHGYSRGPSLTVTRSSYYSPYARGYGYRPPVAPVHVSPFVNPYGFGYTPLPRAVAPGVSLRIGF